ncbi:MAG: LruC domain-containing protein, partial [Muribaculaceae bacterium]|nr:LruC domain-containing protein [Muribaculaceae bacterium]
EDLLGYKEGLTAASEKNRPLFGFSVLVDKDNTLNIDTFNDQDCGFRHIPSLQLGQGSYLIGAPADNKNLTAPQMILVEGDWEWPAELVNIKDAYPSFASWIQNPDANPEWHKNKDNSKVTGK